MRKYIGVAREMLMAKTLFASDGLTKSCSIPVIEALRSNADALGLRGTVA